MINYIHLCQWNDKQNGMILKEINFQWNNKMEYNIM